MKFIQIAGLSNTGKTILCQCLKARLESLSTVSTVWTKSIRKQDFVGIYEISDNRLLKPIYIAISSDGDVPWKVVSHLVCIRDACVNAHIALDYLFFTSHSRFYDQRINDELTQFNKRAKRFRFITSHVHDGDSKKSIIRQKEFFLTYILNTIGISIL